MRAQQRGVLGNMQCMMQCWMWNTPRGATAVPSWSGHEATTALVVCERMRLVILSLSGVLLQTVDVVSVAQPSNLKPASAAFAP